MLPLAQMLPLAIGLKATSITTKPACLEWLVICDGCLVQKSQAQCCLCLGFDNGLSAKLSSMFGSGGYTVGVQGAATQDSVGPGVTDATLGRSVPAVLALKVLASLATLDPCQPWILPDLEIASLA